MPSPDPLLGYSFREELVAAGLDPAVVPFGWKSDTGDVIGTLTGPQQAIFDAVKAAHDPTTLTAEETRCDVLCSGNSVYTLIATLPDSATVDAWVDSAIIDLADAKIVIAQIIKILTHKGKLLLDVEYE